ncbi:hypothetical protein [Bacteroides pyogenes]|uniref:Lipoprotein n=1 Tax=Bacteroides pyogenes TaxID=310300 RepID=A0A5D3EBU4_9BACE|nr:hypothetical protein [Bacteroides pyogenes]TYK33627.1 hypothetical protein FNJ60_07620 [Bacteroides pyogenes]TYK48900.1 hypothetical protein FNG97_06235 [Bacteroides pyogenes]
MKYIWTICLLLICSCNTVKEDTIINEEYEKLFPPKEIEKPENKRGDLVVQLCDPELALENYKYPGTELPGDREEYDITLECLFEEIGKDGTHVETATARYKVKYINDKKELITITCAKNAEEGIPEEEEEEEDDKEHGENDEETGKKDGEKTAPKMINGQKLEFKFKAYSGFPLYLSVTGVGPRNSSVKASIKAVSTDGLIEIPELKSEQYQNEEGPNMLKHPYCEYIILP